LPKCIDYTGVKGSHSANKKTKFWIQQRSIGAPEGTSGLGHRTVRCTPDSVRCTRGLRLKLATFGNFQRHSRYNSPDCPVYTGHVRCSKEERPQELASLGNSLELLRYNSPDRCTSGATATSAPTATCDALNARTARADVRRAHTGAPDNEQDMSGVHRTSRRAQKSEAPTVRIQRHW
jgi:hypothetical protein